MNAGSATRAFEEAIEDSFIRMALGRVTRNRMLFGRAENALGRVAAQDGAVAVALDLFGQAHERLVATGDDAARLIVRQRAQDLGDALRATKVRGSDLTRARREVDEILHGIRTRAGRLASGDLRPNWWDRLFELAERDETVRTALVAFRDACTTGDTPVLRGAAAALVAAVGKRISPSRTKQFRDRLNGVIRRIEAVTPSGDGAKALLALDTYIDSLAPGHPERLAVACMGDAVRANADHWFTVGKLVAGMKAVETLEQARGLRWRLQGLLAEMLTMSTRAYRAVYAQALNDAQEVAKRLNAASGGGWEVVTRRTQVRAPAGGRGQLAQFYDDAIIVRRLSADGRGGEAVVVLATQVKSTDLATARVVDQMLSDIERSRTGIIEFDNVQLTLLADPEVPLTRVFVGTNVPPRLGIETLAATGTSAEGVILPMGGDQIEAVANALLMANGLVQEQMLKNL
uniref:hypothetical protein n=1 Tax=Paractinoplanes polyasparticus TaxID=2856853 RepID=UPI001C852F6E|nr:hypothetical protein [Actinoplanes polyasparticus]